jgi:hypothetical protein
MRRTSRSKPNDITFIAPSTSAAAFAWQDMHLHRFEIRGRECGLSREGGMLFNTDARKVRIDGLKLRRPRTAADHPPPLPATTRLGTHGVSPVVSPVSGERQSRKPNLVSPSNV